MSLTLFCHLSLSLSYRLSRKSLQRTVMLVLILIFSSKPEDKEGFFFKINTPTCHTKSDESESEMQWHSKHSHGSLLVTSYSSESAGCGDELLALPMFKADSSLKALSRLADRECISLSLYSWPRKT